MDNIHEVLDTFKSFCTGSPTKEDVERISKKVEEEIQKVFPFAMVRNPEMRAYLMQFELTIDIDVLLNKFKDPTKFE